MEYLDPGKVRASILPIALAMILSSIIAFIWIVPSGKGIIATDSSGVKIAIRFDDVSWHSNISLVDLFLESMARAGLKTTLGVIPALKQGDTHEPGATRYREIEPGDELS